MKPGKPNQDKKYGNIWVWENFNLWFWNPKDSWVILVVLLYYAFVTCITYFVYFIVDWWSFAFYANMVAIYFHLYNFFRGIFTEPGVIPKISGSKHQQTIGEELPSLLSKEQDNQVDNFENGGLDQQKQISIEDEENEQNEQKQFQSNDKGEIEIEFCPVEMGDSKTNPSLFFQSRFCQKCLITRTPKATHCPICGNCVRKYDHHCSFFGNCVGERNIKFFVQWLLSMCFQGIVYLSVTLAKIYTLIDVEKLKLMISQSLFLQFTCYCTAFMFGFTLWYSSSINSIQSCYNPRFRANGAVVIAILSFVLLYLFYDFQQIFRENLLCYGLFMIFTLPIAIYIIPITVNYLNNVGHGQTEKEKYIRHQLRERKNVGVLECFENIIQMLSNDIPSSQILK